MIASDSAFKAAIYEALCSCLGLSKNSDQAKSMIREAYTEPENSPRPARTADVLYWSVSPADSPMDYASYGVENASTSGSNKASVSRNLAYRLHVVCYGPSSEANAHRIRSYMYLDGKDFPLQILRIAGMYPVPGPPPPEFLYEPEGSLWRRRVDVEITLIVRDASVYSKTRGSVSSGPFVILKH